jgi:hypothetical protein
MHKFSFNADEDIKKCHTPEQEKDSAIRTVALNTRIAAAQYKCKQYLRQ